MLEQYMKLDEIIGGLDKLVYLGGLYSTKQGYQLRDSGGISYTRVHELVLEKLNAIGPDAKQFDMHSLRSGGASAAANAGVPDGLLKTQ